MTQLGHLALVAVARAAAEIHHHRHAQLFGQADGLAADLLVVPGARRIGVQRVAVAAQRADREAVIGELLLEFAELARVGQHGQLAVRIAGVVAGTQLHGIDIQALEFLENVFERQLRQQRCEYADSHGMSPYLAKNHPQNITGTSCEGLPGAGGVAALLEFELFGRSSTLGNATRHDDSCSAEREGRGPCPAGRGRRASRRLGLHLDGRGDEPQRARAGSRDSGAAGDRRAGAAGACRAARRERSPEANPAASRVANRSAALDRSDRSSILLDPEASLLRRTSARAFVSTASGRPGTPGWACGRPIHPARCRRWRSKDSSSASPAINCGRFPVLPRWPCGIRGLPGQAADLAGAVMAVVNVSAQAARGGPVLLGGQPVFRSGRDAGRTSGAPVLLVGGGGHSTVWQPRVSHGTRRRQ